MTADIHKLFKNQESVVDAPSQDHILAELEEFIASVRSGKRPVQHAAIVWAAPDTRVTVTGIGPETHLQRIAMLDIAKTMAMSDFFDQ